MWPTQDEVIAVIATAHWLTVVIALLIVKMEQMKQNAFLTTL